MGLNCTNFTFWKNKPVGGWGGGGGWGGFVFPKKNKSGVLGLVLCGEGVGLRKKRNAGGGGGGGGELRSFVISNEHNSSVLIPCSIGIACSVPKERKRINSNAILSLFVAG